MVSIISIEGRGKINDTSCVRLDFSLERIESLKCQGNTRKKSGLIFRASSSETIGIHVPGVYDPNLSLFTSAM